MIERLNDGYLHSRGLEQIRGDPFYKSNVFIVASEDEIVATYFISGASVPRDHVLMTPQYADNGFPDMLCSQLRKDKASPHLDRIKNYSMRSVMKFVRDNNTRIFIPIGFNDLLANLDFVEKLEEKTFCATIAKRERKN